MKFYFEDNILLNRMILIKRELVCIGILAFYPKRK